MDRKTELKKKFFSLGTQWTMGDDEEFWKLTAYGENEEEFVEFGKIFQDLLDIDDLTCKQLNYLDEIFTKLKSPKS